MPEFPRRPLLGFSVNRDRPPLCVLYQRNAKNVMTTSVNKIVGQYETSTHILSCSRNSLRSGRATSRTELMRPRGWLLSLLFLGAFLDRSGVLAVVEENGLE